MKIQTIHLAPLAILIVFFADSVINAITPIPIGATGITAVSLLLIAVFLSKFNKLSTLDSICLCSATAIMLLPCFKFLFLQDLTLSDFSDAAFLSVFIMTPMTLAYIHKNNSHIVQTKYGIIFFFASLLLITPSFFSIETGSSSINSTIQESSSDLEYLRGYHQGLFRFPHIASYFFLSYSSRFYITKKSKEPYHLRLQHFPL